MSLSQKQAEYGAFQYLATPTLAFPERIQILGSWVADNIVTVPIPQLAQATKGKVSKVSIHKKVAPHIQGLFLAWETAGLLDRVLSFDGSFAPRFIRGSSIVLSNHSFGSAFDINAKWNPLGAKPTKGVGSVLDLVEIAKQLGWFWGGDFSRSDPMHFERAL